ncbi:MAG TPA: DUF177 domain-containing protein [Woeseiaceae bacterium]|nr:DUF177 domain-containing protein [Woeseiaceae bacterium]
MRNPLLDRSSPGELADLGQVVETKTNLGDFSRLSGVVEADLASLPEAEFPREWRQAPVQIRLRFSWIDAGRRLPALEGRVTGSIPVVCQRCLGPMELALDEELKLLLVAPGESAGAKGAADDFEIWELDEATIRPLDILEEALIMAMPLSALHERGQGCDAAVDAEPPVREETNRPFAGLRSQISGRDGEETGSSG